MPPFADAARLRHEHHHGRVLRCYAARPTSVNALWAATVAVRGGAEALVTPTRRYTYAEVDAHAGRFAAGLAARGIVAGDRIAILCGNEPEFVFALIGALRIGAIAVPINVREQTPELAFILNQCTAKAIVFDAPLAARLPWPDDTPRLKVRVSVGAAAGAEPLERLLETAGAVASAARHEDETAVILYTSGTTGHPKGAMLTHFHVVHSALHFRHALGLRPSDRSMLAVPASHVTGLVAVLLAMFECGGCVLALPEFKPAAFLELAAREGMTHTLVVPAIYNLLLRHPAFDPAALAEWRLGGFGGAPMPEGTIRALAERLPNLALFNAYGATETTSPTTVMPPGMQGERLTSVGRVLPCAEVRIMDADGRELPPGEPGEIWIAGPMVVPGYWDNAEATAREFSGGYWKSGDIGSCDADGFVYVHDPSRTSSTAAATRSTAPRWKARCRCTRMSSRRR